MNQCTYSSREFNKKAYYCKQWWRQRKIFIGFFTTRRSSLLSVLQTYCEIKYVGTGLSNELENYALRIFISLCFSLLPGEGDTFFLFFFFFRPRFHSIVSANRKIFFSRIFCIYIYIIGHSCTKSIFNPRLLIAIRSIVFFWKKKKKYFSWRYYIFLFLLIN